MVPPPPTPTSYRPLFRCCVTSRRIFRTPCVWHQLHERYARPSWMVMDLCEFSHISDLERSWFLTIPTLNKDFGGMCHCCCWFPCVLRSCRLSRYSCISHSRGAGIYYSQEEWGNWSCRRRDSILQSIIWICLEYDNSSVGEEEHFEPRHFWAAVTDWQVLKLISNLHEQT